MSGGMLVEGNFARRVSSIDALTVN